MNFRNKVDPGEKEKKILFVVLINSLMWKVFEYIQVTGMDVNLKQNFEGTTDGTSFELNGK